MLSDNEKELMDDLKANVTPAIYYNETSATTGRGYPIRNAPIIKRELKVKSIYHRISLQTILKMKSYLELPAQIMAAYFRKLILLPSKNI